MHDLPLPKRIYYGYLGYLYWFTHYTSTHRVLGIRLSTIVKLLVIFLTLAAWFYRWSDAALIISSFLLVWIFMAYWRARRTGYFHFVPDIPAQVGDQKFEKLAPYRRIACIATGVFSLHDWEKNVLFRPAAYWQVPHGDHGLMVEHEPHRYLYQFFNVATMDEFQRGWLLYGPHPKPALSISYLSIWGPEFTQIQFSIFGSEKKPTDPKLRTIFISFPSPEDEELIYQNILSDVQGHRSKEPATDAAN